MSKSLFGGGCLTGTAVSVERRKDQVGGQEVGGIGNPTKGAADTEASEGRELSTTAGSGRWRRTDVISRSCPGGGGGAGGNETQAERAHGMCRYCNVGPKSLIYGRPLRCQLEIILCYFSMVQ